MSPGARRRRNAKRRRTGKIRAARREVADRKRVIRAKEAAIKIQIGGNTMELNAQSTLSIPPRHAKGFTARERAEAKLALEHANSIEFTTTVHDEYDDAVWFTTKPTRSVFDQLEQFRQRFASTSDDVADALAYGAAAIYATGH